MRIIAFASRIYVNFASAQGQDRAHACLTSMSLILSLCVSVRTIQFDRKKVVSLATRDGLLRAALISSRV